MIKRLLFSLSIIFAFLGKTNAQCPQFYDGAGTLTNTPSFIYCQAGAYSMGLMSPAAFSAYTIDWGDGTANTTGASNPAMTPINHVYAAAVNTFVLTFNMPAAACSRTMLVVLEQAVAAGAQNFGGVTTFCAPGTVTVTNISTNVSPTTQFTWDWGDGNSQTFDYTNQNQNIIHTFAAGNVPSCQRQITLRASNACRPIPNPLNLFVDIYDTDPATVAADRNIKCSPENTFTLTNTTARQCFAQGNTFQRQEKWNLGDYWGRGHDSIIDWRPWPPTTPVVIQYPLIIGVPFNITMIDSNLCGQKTAFTQVFITSPPTASLIPPTGNLCQNTSITFTNGSAAGFSYLWNFGTGAGFQNVGAGNPSRTYPSPGTFTVKVVAFVPGSNAACSDTSRSVITILASPVANFSLTPATGCSSITNVQFTDLSTGANTYLWRFGNTFTSTAVPPPLQNYTNTGVFIATLVVTGTTSCVNTKTASIVVRSTPVPNFPIIQPCVGAVGNFTNTSTVTGTTAINSYTWDFGDGSATSTATNPAHTFTAAGIYSVSLKAATPFCNEIVVKTVSVNVKPTADFAFTPTINCPPFAVTFTNNSANATNYTWKYGTAPSASLATTSLANTTFTYNNATQGFLNFTVSLTASTGSGCSDVITKSLTVKPKPVANFMVNTSGGCSPLATTFTNNSIGAVTYTWDLGDGVGSTNVTPVHSYSNTTLLLLTNTITLVATNSISCTDTLMQTIQVFPEPLTTFTMTPGNGCTPLTVTFPPVPGIVSYTWNFGDGSPILVATTPTVHVFTNTNTVNQSYTVNLTASNAFGCVASSSKVPIIYPIPVPNFLLGPTAGCSPLSTTLTNVSTGATTYSWTFGDGVVSTNTNTSHTYTNTTHTTDENYIVTLIAITNNGCKDSIKKTVQVYYRPQAAFTFNNPQCLSQSITFTNSTIGLAASSWSFGDGTPLSTTVNPVHQYTNTTLNNLTFPVQLVVSSIHSCTNAATGTPTVWAHPVMNFSLSPSEGCSPLSATLSNSSQFAHTYLWRYGDGTATATSTNTSHTYSNTSYVSNQTFSATLIGFNNNGCKDSLKKAVLVYNKPNASFTQNDPRCASQTINFTNTSLGNAVNSWSFGDVTPLSSALSPSHTYTNTTLNNINYTVQLVVTTASLCTDTAFGYPIIYAHPIPGFVVSPTVGCSPLITSMTNNSQAAHNYKWKFSDGTTSTLQTTNHTYSNTSNTSNQNFNTTLVVYNNNGCRDSLTVPLLLYYKPKSNFELDTPACTPKVITFTNTSIGATAYFWDHGDGTTSTSSNTAHQYVNNTPFNQTFTVSLVSNTTNNCKDTLKVKMIVHPQPQFFISSQPDSGCSPLTVFFPKLAGVTSYRWFQDDGFFDDKGDISVTLTNDKATTRTINIKLVAKDIYGCPDTATTLVRVFPKPVASFTAFPLSVYIPNQATYMTNVSVGASTYSWTFGDGGESNDFQPSHTYTTPGEFPIILMVSNTKGCRDTAELGKKVMALDETTVITPNAFTPNPAGSPGSIYTKDTDLNNDIYHPNVKGAEKYQFSVYSRWGELLFETKNPDEGWDGYYRGQICTQDVYIWKVVATFVDGKIYNKTGDLLLLR